MLAAASLVLLMTPALAFFYGGMTRSKSALNMMMTGFGALAVVGPVWMLWGYLETFGTNVTGIVGDPFEFFALHDPTDDGGPMAATGVLIGLFANVTCAADGVVTSYTWAPVGALNGRFYGGGIHPVGHPDRGRRQRHRDLRGDDRHHRSGAVHDGLARPGEARGRGRRPEHAW